MALEKAYSLRAAAKLIGISSDTLKRWLAEELGLVLPRVSRGSKILIRESHVEMVYRAHVAQTDWHLLRGKSARRSGV